MLRQNQARPLRASLVNSCSLQRYLTIRDFVPCSSAREAVTLPTTSGSSRRRCEAVRLPRAHRSAAVPTASCALRDHFRRSGIPIIALFRLGGHWFRRKSQSFTRTSGSANSLSSLILGLSLKGTNPVSTRFLRSDRRIHGDSAQRNGPTMFASHVISPHSIRLHFNNFRAGRGAPLRPYQN